MLREVWQALNCLSIHATYCVTVAGAFPGKQKCGLRYVKTAIFCTCGSNNWETVEDRWVHAARGLASIELSFHPCNILRDSCRGVSRGNKNVGCGIRENGDYFAVGHRKTEPGGYFCRKLTLTRTPDPIRPTRRGPDPNRPSNGKKTRGLWPTGVCPRSFGWTPPETIGDSRTEFNKILCTIWSRSN